MIAGATSDRCKSGTSLHEGQRAALGEKWDADAKANFQRRLGKTAHDLGTTGGDASCPEIWELDNGDVAIIGTDLTASYRDRLPSGVSIDPGEKLVIIPRATLVS